MYDDFEDYEGYEFEDYESDYLEYEELELEAADCERMHKSSVRCCTLSHDTRQHMNKNLGMHCVPKS